jgi:hypothetical protein
MDARPKRLEMAGLILASLASSIWIAPSAKAAQASVQISVKNHRFQPAQIQAPANKPIILHIRNLDATPMEFESVSLRVEKVITGSGKGIIRLRPLSPGSYEFFDDFHEETRGTLVVK